MMFYEKAGHGIFVDSQYYQSEKYYLAIDTLELVLEYASNKLLYVQGYFPLVKAKRETIFIPDYKVGNYLLNDMTKEIVDKKGIELAISYDYFSIFSESKNVFTLENQVFDESKGIIKFGVDKVLYEHIKISENLIVSVDSNNELECIYIKPDKFI